MESLTEAQMAALRPLRDGAMALPAYIEATDHIDFDEVRSLLPLQLVEVTVPLCGPWALVCLTEAGRTIISTAANPP